MGYLTRIAQTTSLLSLDEVLKVDRHGNSVSVSMNEPVQIKRNLPGVYFTLPAFNIELNAVEGEDHSTQQKPLSTRAIVDLQTTRR